MTDLEIAMAGASNPQPQMTDLQRAMGQQSQAVPQSSPEEMEPRVPTPMPNMEQAGGVSEFFTGRKYTPEQVDEYINFRMESGVRKNDALNELKSMDATPLDMSNASYSGLSQAAPTQAASDIAGADAAQRGLLRTGLGMGQISSDIAGGLGLDNQEVNTKIEGARGYLKDKNQMMEDTYGMQSPVEQGIKYAPEVLTAAVNPTKILTTAGLEGYVAGMMARGEGKSGIDSLSEAGKGAAFGAGGVITGKVVGSLADNYVSTLSNEVKAMIKGTDVTEKQLDNILKGVPKADQARVLSEQSGQLGQDFLNKALSDNIARKAFTKDMKARNKIIEEAYGKGDLEAVKTNAKKAYVDMGTELQKSGINLNMTNLIEDVSGIRKVSAKGDSMDLKMEKIGNEIAENPNYSLDQVVELRESINDVLRTAKGKSKHKAIALKERLDKIVKAQVPSEYSKLLEDTIGSYRNMKQQQELYKILDAPSVKKSSGVGSDVFETGVIDYAAAAKKVREAGLDSPETMQTLKILDHFGKKFNNDFSLFSSSAAKGSNPEEGALGIMSKIAAEFKSMFWRFGEFGDNIAIQHNITKSLKNSRTPTEFARNMINTKGVSKAIKETLETNLKNAQRVRQNNQSSIATKTIDDKLSAQLQGMEIQKGKASISIQKQEVKLSGLDDRIDKLVSKELDGTATEASTAALYKAKQDKLIALQEMEIKQQQHANSASKLDKAKGSVEKLKVVEDKSPIDQLKVSQKKNAFDLPEINVVKSPRTQDGTESLSDINLGSKKKDSR